MEYSNNILFDKIKIVNNKEFNNDFTLSNINKKKIKRIHSTEINNFPFINNINNNFDNKDYINSSFEKKKIIHRIGIFDKTIKIKKRKLKSIF